MLKVSRILVRTIRLTVFKMIEGANSGNQAINR